MTAIDVSEDKLHREDPRVLELLLRDQTTKRNIVWATSSYEYLGKGFAAYQALGKSKVTGIYKDLIQPRSAKHESEQKSRTKSHAEVFTPTWIVDKQVTIALDSLKDLSFEDYIDSKWLEITCGEAPYIVTPYDTVTGEPLALVERVGFLDRKMQRISQEMDQSEDWLHWVVRAYQATYGYEYQGDSLLLARENLYMTFLDYYQEQFGQVPDEKMKHRIAGIISYNVFQMDGLAYTTPYSETQKDHVQLSLFEDDLEEDESNQAQKTQIKDWKKKKTIGFERLSSGEEDMKFDVVIGNPPYQREGDARDEPIYHTFVDESYKIGNKVCLITPARFLFNAGQTPKPWMKKMLSDEHIKVPFYKQKSSEVFPGTDIKGGVAITYRDLDKNFGKIGTFTVFEELNSIVKKVENRADFSSFSPIVYPQGIYRFSEKFFEDYPDALNIQGKGTKSKIVSKSLVNLDFAFSTEGSENDVQLLGRIGNDRVFRFIKKDYVDLPDVFYNYNIFVPEANGSGAIGEVLSTPLIGEPLIGEPLIGHTDTFLTIGNFESNLEAENCLKYVKTKFARTMLGVLKITQHNSRNTWAKVPLQDFTVNSDIDWSQSVANIDRQLYKKYQLSPEEITFIETKVKEME